MPGWRSPTVRCGIVPWVVGLAVALVSLGPALGPGSLLSLDLVVPPTIPLPRGTWGLGPDLPRRVPLGVPLALASTLVGGPLAAKLLFSSCITVAFVGVWRLASVAPLACRLGAGLLYALSPFTLTRLGVGHWMLLATIAVLPWALPALLRPTDDARRTFLWAAALAATGVNGGLYGAVLVSVGVLADRGRGAGRTIVLFLLAQLPWLVPGVIVFASGPELADPGSFATRLGSSGPLGLVVGGGFWRQSNQVGNVAGVGPMLLGLGLVGLSVVPGGGLPAAWRRRAATAGAIGFGLALVSAVPFLERLFAAFAATPLGAPLRDGQRMLGLFLVWLAPSVAFGAAALARGAGRGLAPLLRVLPSGAALVLAAPALSGIGGALEPVSFPNGWFEAREVVEQAPGTVLALPWHQYLDVSFADNRRIFNPVPDFFGGDVLSSSDPELGTPSREQADPREPHVAEVERQLRSGASQSETLARLGVRWVVLLQEADWRSYTPALAEDPGLEHVVRTPSVELYRVRRWNGPFLDPAGTPVASRSPIAPLVRLEGAAPVTWQRPAAPGWLRGTTPAGRSASGLIELPAGRGLVWYWPATLTLLAYVLTLAGAATAICRLRQEGQAPVDTGRRPAQLSTGRQQPDVEPTEAHR